MQDKYFESYNKLDINDKRNNLIKEISDTLNAIEILCIKRKIKVDKLKSSYYLKNRKLLFDNDYYELMFVYITYLKEDLALLLNESA